MIKYKINSSLMWFGIGKCAWEKNMIRISTCIIIMNTCADHFSSLAQYHRKSGRLRAWIWTPETWKWLSTDSPLL